MFLWLKYANSIFSCQLYLGNNCYYLHFRLKLIDNLYLYIDTNCHLILFSMQQLKC